MYYKIYNTSPSLQRYIDPVKNDLLLLLRKYSQHFHDIQPELQRRSFSFETIKERNFISRIRR